MGLQDEPLITKLGGTYYKDSQVFVPLGVKTKTSQQSGHSLAMLIGYDKEKRRNHEPSIIQCLPIVLYLPLEPTLDLCPENWKGEYIRRIVGERTHWDTLPKTHLVRQFYNRFINPNRRDKKLDVMAQPIIFPMSEDFFNSLDFIKVRVCNRLSIIYRYKDDNVVHLADAYCLHSDIPAGNEKVSHEFLTPVFVSDEDATYANPENTSLGKLTLKCPLDSQYVITSLSKKTDSMFNSRKIIYEGVDIDTLKDVRIEDEPRYQGNEQLFLIKLLNNIRTITIEADKSTHDYYVEKTHPSIKIDKTSTHRIHFYTEAEVDIPYDQYSCLSKNVHKHNVNLSLPYYNNEIRKMFGIKLTNAQQIALQAGDYIGINL